MEQKGPHTAPTTIPLVQFYSTWYFQDLSVRSCLSFPLITEELEVSISQTEVCLCTRMSMAVYHGMQHHEDCTGKGLNTSISSFMIFIPF